VFDFLVEKKGKATPGSIANALTMSKSTALKYMTELTAVGLTELKDVVVSGNPTQQIRLLKEYAWLYSDEFLRLKGDYSPIDRSKYDLSEHGNDERDSEKTRLFWRMFEELEAEAPETKHVELSRLQKFILNQSFGVFDGLIQIEIFVKKMIASGKIVPVLGVEWCYVRAAGKEEFPSKGGV
jgi:hypothetical protein